jgi:hypothetical protein
MKWVCLIGAGVALAYAYYSESASGLERLALVALALSALCRLAEVKGARRC